MSGYRLALLPFQQRAERELARGVSWSVMADRAGYIKAGKADTTRLRRRLGLVPLQDSGQLARTCCERVAADLARAVDADPHELGF
jgi:hypothetical protein